MQSMEIDGCETPSLHRAPFKRNIGGNELAKNLNINGSINISTRQRCRQNNHSIKESDISKNKNYYANLEPLDNTYDSSNYGNVSEQKITAKYLRNENSIEINQLSTKYIHRKNDPEKSKCQTFRMNYNTWKWQPTINLNRLKSNEENTSIEDGSPHANNPVSPIEFDSDESFIREMSPETAQKKFRQRLENIKKINQSDQINSNESKTKRSRAKKVLSAEVIKYEETHKRLQIKNKKKQKNKRIVGRRLYSHNDSLQQLDGIAEKENSEQIEEADKPSQKLSRLIKQSVRIVPYRVAKNNSLNKSSS